MKKFISKISQLLVSIVIFFMFIAYAWAIQLNYDANDANWKKAILFALIVFLGSFSYDVAKHLAYLKTENFKAFLTHIRNALLTFAVGLVLIIGLAIIWGSNSYASIFILFTVLIVFMFVFVNQISDAIDSTNKGNVNFSEEDFKQFNQYIKSQKALSAKSARDNKNGQKTNKSD